MLLYGLDVEELSEGDLFAFFRHFFLLDDKLRIPLVQNPISLVVQACGKELDLFCHLK